MATEVGTAYVTLIPSAKGFASRMQSEVSGEVAQAGTATGAVYGDSIGKGAESRMSKVKGFLSTGLKTAGIGAAIAAGAAIVKTLTGSIEEAREAQVVTARTANVIESMGNVAGISAKGVADLASAISAKTGIDDEAIQAGQNLLLTFKNVQNQAGEGNDVFNQATQLMTDMSAALGTDAKGSAIQLGKALNDPIKGVSALTRVGVSFNEQQTEQITRMQEAGNTLGAQKIILGEVQKQFGGAAEAMATPADKAKTAWANFQESIGTALLPVLDKVLEWVALVLPKITELFSGGGGEAGGLVAKFAGVFNAIKNIVAGVIQIITVLWRMFGQDLLRYISATFDNLMTIIGGALRIIQGVINVVLGLLTGDWARAWKGIKQILSGAWQIIKGVVRQGINLVRTILSMAWTVIKAIFGKAWDAIVRTVSAGINRVVSWVKSLPGKMLNALRNVGSALGRLFSSAWDKARETVVQGATAVVNFIKGLPGKILALGSKFAAAGKTIIGKFVDGLKNAAGVVGGIAGNVWDAVRGTINSGIDQLNRALSFTIRLPGPDLHIDVDIPRLAGGGRATSGTLALIGEGREPETVLPDSMLRGLLERTAVGAGSSVGELVITNWHEGTGYFRLVASGEVAADHRFRRGLGAMHA